MASSLASPTPQPNGTILVETGLGDMATRAAFLALFIIVGFVGNCLLIAMIAQSSRLKSCPINVCIISLAVTNILDSAVNMPIILGATITEKWDYGQLACRLNAFGIQLASVAAVSGLMLLVVERFIAVLDPDKQRRRLGSRRIAAIIGFFWIYGFAFSAPLALDGVVPIDVFPVRYLCTIANGAPLLYLCLTSIFCFLLPIAVCLCLFVYVVRRAVRIRRKESERRKHLGYAAGSQPPDKVWSEIEGAKFAAVMFALWLLLQAPYHVVSSVTWYRNSAELAGNEAVSEALYFKYPPELELALTWIKLSYPMFLPAVTFLWKKRVWQRCRSAFSRRKSNLVVHASLNGSPGAGGPVGAGATPALENGVPVLFATENGLRIQTYNDDDSDELDADSETRDNSVSQTVTKECDVYGSQFMQLDGDDTSDYDSSSDLDPLSGSNPVPVPAPVGHGHKRSVSSGARRPPANSGTGGLSGRGETGEVRSSSEPHLQAAAAEAAVVARPPSAGSKASCKKTKRRLPSDGTGSIREEVTIQDRLDVDDDGDDNDDDDLHIDHPALADGADDACQATERTSHDSGMGSLGKPKKPKKRKKKKASTEEVCEIETRPEAKPSETVDLEPKCASCENADALDGKRRSKKRPLVEKASDGMDDSAANCEHKAAGNDAAVNVKAPARLPPLATAEGRSGRQPEADEDRIGDGETNVRRPTVPPRKVNSGKCVGEPRDDEPATRPIPEPRRSLRSVSDNGDRVLPQRRPSKHKSTKAAAPDTHDEQDSGCTRNGEEVSRAECSKEKPDSSDAVQDPGVDRGSRRARRKRRHKAVDRDAQQRRLAEELDQEIQGVLY